MKKTFLSLLSIAALSFYSCSDDSNEQGLVTVDPDPTEETALTPSDVSDNLVITAGTRMNGDAPQPTGSLSFTIDDSEQTGFQQNGFDITFNAPAGYAGSYIQITDANGNTAPNYWDIPFGPVKASKKGRTSLFTQRVSSTKMQNQIDIDVDFTDDMPAGTFCYLICIYDDNGNISAPTEICVEVEAWGGNDNLIDTWELYRSEETYEGTTWVQEIGVETCEEYDFFCNSSETYISVENGDCETLVVSNLVINADGTYVYNSESTGSIVDYEPSSADPNCDPVIINNDDTYMSRGNWAYDEEEGTLTIVEFEYQEDDYPIELEPYGYLIFSGPLTFDGTNNFTVYSEDEFDGFVEAFKGYFRRK